MAPRHGACPGAIPGNRTISFTIYDFRLAISKQAARQLAQSGFQNLTGVGQHHGGLPNRKS
jgi:hypothetical protein